MAKNRKTASRAGTSQVPKAVQQACDYALHIAELAHRIRYIEDVRGTLDDAGLAERLKHVAIALYKLLAASRSVVEGVRHGILVAQKTSEPVMCGGETAQTAHELVWKLGEKTLYPIWYRLERDWSTLSSFIKDLPDFDLAWLQAKIRNESELLTPRHGTDPIQRMREAIASTQDGKNAKADTLVKNASISKEAGRAALRELEATGEYRGFQRKRRSHLSR